MRIIQNSSDHVEFEQAIRLLENITKGKLDFWLSESRNPTSQKSFRSAQFAKNEADQIIAAIRIIRRFPQVFSTRFIDEFRSKCTQIETLESELFLIKSENEILKILIRKESISLIKKYYLS